MAHRFFDRVSRILLSTMLVCTSHLLLASVMPTAASATALTTLERISVGPAGIQGNGPSSYFPAISQTGRYVSFSSAASNLVEGDTNGVLDVFVRDRVLGITRRVSVSSAGAEGNARAGYSSGISADGRYVVFSSQASNLVNGDTNGVEDVFVHDVQSGTTWRVSVGSQGQQAESESYDVSISANGLYVAFTSTASNLVAGDTNFVRDVFVRGLVTGVTERVSLSSTGQQANNTSTRCDISGDGRYVAFHSAADNLVTADQNGVWDTFVRDRSSGTTTRVSVASDGLEGNSSSGYNPSLSISDDGRCVAFASTASNLVPGDTNGQSDVFVRDIATRRTTRVSVASDGAQANSGCENPMLSGDGSLVLFSSTASNLVDDDTNASQDIFVHDRIDGSTGRVSCRADGTEGNSSTFWAGALSQDGRVAAFGSLASNLVVDDTNGAFDMFAHEGELAGNGEAQDPYIIRTVSKGTPIILISGLFSSTDDGTWDRVERELRTSGYNVRKAPTAQGATSPLQLNSTGSLSDNSHRLANYLATQTDLAGRDVILVGHSMGGIIARAFADNPENVAFSGVDVKAIVQIGSPNNGSPFATLASLLPFTESPATHDLSTWNMSHAFNPTHTNTAGTPIYQLGGDFFPAHSSDHIPSYWDDPVDWGLEHLAQEVNEAAFSHGLNDGLVSVSSLEGPSYLRGRVWVEPRVWNLRHSKGTYTKGSFGVFTDVGTIPPRTDIYGDDDGLADSFMRSLKGALYDAAANASQSLGAAAAASARSCSSDASEYGGFTSSSEPASFTSGGFKTLPAAVRTLTESSVASVSRSLEGTTALLTVVWSAGDVDVAVSDGSGAVECVTVSEDTGSLTLLAQDADPGELNIDLGLSGAPSSDATLTIVDSGPSALCLDAASESIAAQPVAVSAYLGEGLSKLADTHATATLGEDTAVLADDGVAPDATAGDGVLSGYVDAPAAEGLYDITVIASGTDSAGHTVEREAFAQIAVSEPVATLTGSYLLHGVEGAAALLGSVDLDVGVVASSDASLSLGADFVSGGGILLAQPKTSTHLSAGEEATVTLTVSAEALYAALPATDTVDAALVSLRHLMPDSDVGLDSAQDVGSFGPVGPFDLAVGALSLGVSGSSPTSDPKVGFSGTAVCTTETVAGIEVSFDGGEAWYPALPTDGAFDSGLEDYYVWALLPEGNWAVRARALGAQGPLPGDEVRAETAVIVDSTPPETTDDAPLGWQTQETTVTLSATDDLSGVAATYYTLDSGPDTEYTEPLVLEHGTHTLTYWSVDAAGNTEEAHEVAVFVDTEPPAGTMLLSGGATYSDASITIDSDVDGATQMRFVASRDGITWGGGPGWIDYADSVEVGVSGGGRWYYKVDYRDEAGNTLTLVDDVDVDADAPTTTSDALLSYDDVALITLEATDAGGSGLSQTYYALNGADPTAYTAPIQVSGFGTQVLEYWSIDSVGNVEDHNIDIFSVIAVTRHFEPIAGTNRYSTAIEASKRAYPGGADTVVIATGTNWPDALGGAALAGVVDGPLLLTKTDALPDSVLAEVERLGATDAYILGGTAAVSTGVQDTLEAHLSGEVTRLAGTNRYSTADLVANKVIELQGSAYDHDAFIATGANFPDALGASPLAASSSTPILLVKLDATPHLPTSVDEATILGGTGAVSAVTESAVRSALGTSKVTRVGGTDRYDTAAKIAEFGVAHGMHWDGVGIATGAEFPDAMSGGAMLGSFDSVMLLTKSATLSSAASQRLSANKDVIGTVHFIGGTSAVSDAVRQTVEQVLQ